MTTKRLRIGVIGVGFGSRVQIPGFQAEDMEVVAVCTRRREGAERAAQEFGIPGVYTDYRQMLQHPGLDAVSIATPPVSHREIALAALDAGKHVLCEKAFAMDQGQAREMWQKAEQTGLTAMVNHLFRFAPGRAYVKDLLQQGYVGDIRTVHTTLFMGPTRSPRPRPMAWGSQASQGGGFLKALGSHYIDGLLDWSCEITRVCGSTFLLNAERVDPESGRNVRADTDDSFGFIFTLKNGGWGSMSASSASPFGSGAMIQIYGTQGTLQTPQRGANPAPDGIVLGAKFAEGHGVQELPMPGRFRPFDDPRDERSLAFRLLVRRFIQGIAEGSSPSPNFYDGFRCQQVMDAVAESGVSGRWVDIPTE